MTGPGPSLPKVRVLDGHDWYSIHVTQRNLPHWEHKGSTYFVTLNVDSKLGSPFRDPKVAKYMIEALAKNHTITYLLHAYVIMPNHLHLIIKPLGENTLAKIMQLLKGSSAHGMNQLLQRTGKFWQTENFDHLIRDNLGLREKWDYVKENPVRARLVDKAEDYPFSSFYVPKAQL